MAKEIDKYLKIEERFFSAVKKEFGKDLLLYCVTGGLGRKEIIEGWSDIDVLLVFDLKFDEGFYKRFKKIFGRKYPIKVGCTFYTKDEFINTPYKDAKTLHSICLIKAGVYVPRINKLREKFKTVRVSLTPCFDLGNFAGGLHELKRELLVYPALNEKKIVKIIFRMMKIILRDAGFKVYGYEDTAKHFAKIFPDFNHIITPRMVIRDTIAPKQRYLSYLFFLDYIKSTKYARVRIQKR